MSTLHTMVVKLMADTAAFTSGMTGAGTTSRNAAGNIDAAAIATDRQKLAAQKAAVELQIQTERLGKMTTAAGTNSTAVEKQRIKVEELRLATQELSVKQDKTVTSTDKLTTSVEKSGSAAEASSSKMAGLGSVLSSVVVAGAAVAAAAIAAIGAAAVGSITAVTNWADKVDAIGDVLGTSANDSAALAVAIQRVGGDAGQLGAQLGFLGKNLKTADGKLGTSGLALKQLGVSAYDAKGKLKDSAVLIVDVANKVSKMPDGLKKSSLMMELFGKSGRDMSDVMNSLANGGFKDAQDMAGKLGLAIGDDGVDKALAFKRGIAEMQLSMEGLAVSIGSDLLPVIMPALKSIGDWVIANMPAIRTAIGNLITNVGGFLSGLMGTAGTVLPQVATTIQTAVGGVISWVQANWPTIQTIVNGVLTTIGNIVTTVVIPAVTAIIAGLSQVVGWVIANWPQISATISTVLTAVVTAVNTYVVPVISFMLEKFQQIVGWVQQNWPLISQAIGTVLNVMWTQVQDVFGKLQPFIGPIFESIKGIINTAIALIEGTIKTVMQLITGDWEGAWNTIKQTVSNVMDGVVQFLGGLPATMVRLAGDMMKGLAEGILAEGDRVVQALKKIIEQAIADFKKALGIASPSKVFAEIGQNMALGLVQGYSQSLKPGAFDITPSVKFQGAGIARSDAGGVRTTSDGPGGFADQPVTINLYVGDEKLQTWMGRSLRDLLSQDARRR